MSMKNKTCILIATICLTTLSLSVHARVGGAGVGYGNRGAAGAPSAPAAGRPDYGVGGAAVLGAPAAGRLGYGR